MIDVLVIGAGFSGLCAAKTFLEHDGDAKVVILERQKSLGGVWSRELLYPTLKTNNLWSSMDYLDFPMDQSFGVKPGEHVPGETMNAYLEAYARKFGLTGRIQLESTVVEVKRRDPGGEGWIVTVESAGGVSYLECGKLVVATGITSTPHRPQLPGSDDFDRPIIHSSELGPQSATLTGDARVRTVAVLGGSKSAYDAVYLAASTGHDVEWIIRRSGRGPTWVFPIYTFLGPFKAWRERLVTRRFVAFMCPSIFPEFAGFSWLKNVLHSTAVGRALVRAFWGASHADTIRDCRYRTEPCLGVLEPEQSPFWFGTASGVLNWDRDIADFIKGGRVRIHRQDVSHLASGTIHLADGTALAADALVTSTGFSAKPKIRFHPETLHSDLGVPSDHLDKTQRSFWSRLDLQSDVAIGTQFPRLLVGPHRSPGSSSPKPFHPGMTAEVSYTPWRLYRGIAPPGLTAAGDRSLVFLGMFSNLANTIRLDIQCLWALAYFHGKLRSVDEDVAKGAVFEETSLLQRFAHHRAPYGHGRFYPDLVFEQMGYWELLLHDLGLPIRRKANWFRELFEPYSQEDYRGIAREWMRRNRQPPA